MLTKILKSIKIEFKQHEIFSKIMLNFLKSNSKKLSELSNFLKKRRLFVETITNERT